MKTLLPPVIVASLLGLAPQAWGQDSDPLRVKEPLGLLYEAPEECPDRAALERRLGRAFPSFQLSTDPYAPLLIARIRADDGEFRGTLELPPESSPGEPDKALSRLVHAPECQDVFDSLNLFVAQYLSERNGHEYPPGRILSASDDTKALQAAAKETGSPAVETEVPDVSGSLARRPEWLRRFRLHHKKESPAGQLRLDRLLSMDLQAGASYGLLPGTPLPRVDLSVRSARFLTTPGERPFLLGFLPRIRGTAHVPTTAKNSEGEREVSGYTLSAGGCLSPYYDPTGLVLLACAEGGGGVLLTGQSIYADRAGYSMKVGVLRLGASLETEYNLSPAFHLALRAGYEANLPLNLPSQREDGSDVFQPGKDSIYGTLGVGLHF